MSANKHKSFLQDGSITLGVSSQTDPKYQKQPVYNIFAISQGKHEGWSWFFACWQMLKVFSNWYYHFRCVWPGMSKLPKITSLLFLYNMLRKKWVMQLIFYMQISMKACYKLILRFFDGYGQAFPKFPKYQICNAFTISLKKVRNEVDFFDVDKHQSFLPVDFNTLGIKFFYKVIGMIMKTWRAWSWKWSSIIKVLKVTCLQCFYNISKKKLWMEFILEFIKIKTSTSWIVDFWWK